MKKALFSLFVVVAAAMLLSTCTKGDPDTLPQPEISFGQTPDIVAEGGTDLTIEISIVNGGGRDVTVGCDGVVITNVIYTEPYIVFSASATDTYAKRTGWIDVACGPTVVRGEFTQIGGDNLPAIAGKSGWFELPALHREGEYICYSHDRLPSDPSKRNYSFCFAPEHCASLWVAYPLHECYLGSADRTNKFGYDYAFAAFAGDDTDEPAMQANIGKNAYYPQGGGTSNSHSRGHQLPSADRTGSTEDNWTTFYATNMTPQLQSLNGGAWEKLENLTRNTWICSDTLYVVTGALFDAGYTYAYDNKGNGKACSVPTHYYKALLRTKDGSTGKSVAECTADELKCIGFIFTHDTSRGSQQVYTSDACSVAELEQRTGMTFFVNVPNAPKTTCNTSEWSGLSANR